MFARLTADIELRVRLVGVWQLLSTKMQRVVKKEAASQSFVAIWEGLLIDGCVRVVQDFFDMLRDASPVDGELLRQVAVLKTLEIHP